MRQRHSTSWDEIASAERLSREQADHAEKERKHREAQARREQAEVIDPLRGRLARNHLAELFEAAMRGRGGTND